MNQFASFLSDSVGIAVPILAAAMGGLYTEASGALNIALEGLIMAGAFSFAATAGLQGSILMGWVVALFATVLFSLLIAFAADRWEADVFVAALAVNLLIGGLVSIASEHVFGTKGVVPLPSLLSARTGLGMLSSLPVLGAALFRQRGVSYLAGLAVFAMALGFSKTPFGLRVRAAGMQEGSLRIAGVKPEAVRYGAYAVSGIACAIAGIALISSVGAWVPNISSGRGWVALVVIYLGGKRPRGIALAALGFGILFAFSNAAQAFLAAPPELIMALPYAATATAVLLGGTRGKSRRPGRPVRRARDRGTAPTETPDGRSN